MAKIANIVKGEIKGDELVLTFDISAVARAAAAPSRSGKTRILATTSGFTRFGDVSVSVNATIAPDESV